MSNTPEQAQQNKKTNKKILKWFGIAIAIFIFMGMCGALLGDSETAPAANTTASETVEAPAPAPEKTEAPKAPETKAALTEDDKKNIFHMTLESMGVDVDKSLAYNNAKNACRRLDNGDEVVTVALGLMQNLGDDYTSGAVLGGATEIWCPQHKAAVKEALGQ